MARPTTALVVEADYLIASLIEAPLAQSGCQVVVALDKDEARAAIAARDFDIAVLDFRLSHGDEGGIVERLGAAGIPYLFCTAATLDEVHDSFPGACVLEKPFGDDMLLQVIGEVLDGPGGQAARSQPDDLRNLSRRLRRAFGS